MRVKAKRKVVMVEVSAIERAFPLASAYLRNHAKRYAESAGDTEFVIRAFSVSN